jgi:hypothetical protein
MYCALKPCYFIVLLCVPSSRVVVQRLYSPSLDRGNLEKEKQFKNVFVSVTLLSEQPAVNSETRWTEERGGAGMHGARRGSSIRRGKGEKEDETFTQRTPLPTSLQTYLNRE